MGNCQSKSPEYNKYCEGKIYKIICNKTGKVYYGSTIKTLKARLSSHKQGHYTSAHDILESGNYRIELVELYPCGSK